MLLTKLSQRGWEVRRSHASRRQRILADGGVDLVVDVGAAVGSYGRELRASGYKGEILSLEPLAESFALLRGIAAKDCRWSVLCAAAGAETGSVELNIAGNNDSSSILPMLPAHRIAAPHANYVSTQEVSLVTLDAVVAGKNVFLKIDAQGYEAAVLDGAVEVLGRTVAVELEVSFVPLYAGAMTYQDMYARMRSYGFRPADAKPGLRDASGLVLQADVLFVRAQ